MSLFVKPLLSRYAEKKRINIVRPYLKGNVLDLGCGFTKIPSILNNEQHYCGVDQNPIAIQWAQRNYPNHDFIEADIASGELELGSYYDTILLLAVIEHIKNPIQIFKQTGKILSPLGRVIITTPTPVGGYIHKIGALAGLFYKSAMYDHVRFYDQYDLARFLLQDHLDLIEYRKFLLCLNQLFICKMKH
jgi:SAM-dependent methyltransferase